MWLKQKGGASYKLISTPSTLDVGLTENGVLVKKITIFMKKNIIMKKNTLSLLLVLTHPPKLIILIKKRISIGSLKPIYRQPYR